MDPQHIQREIFEQVRSQINNKKWIEEIAQVLGRSKNSIYKKLSGEIGLSIDEIAKLSERYRIYMDPIFQPNRTVSFDFPFLSQQDTEIDNYFHSLSSMSDQFSKMPDLRVWMSQMEIPFIHDYNFPEITAFKFFIHEKTIWRPKARVQAKFSLEKSLAKPGFKEILKKLLHTYYQVPSVEFWHSLILDITLSQIKYALEIGAFEDPLDALVLCERLIDFVNHTQYMADLGLKITADENNDIKQADFVLYHNEVAHSNNLIFLEGSKNSTVFMNFGNPNFIYSSVGSVVDYTTRWFEILKDNSQLITRESRQSRLSFFNELRKKIDNTMLEINTLMKLQRL